MTFLTVLIIFSFYKLLRNDSHEYHIKQMQMLRLRPTALVFTGLNPSEYSS